MAAIKEGLDKLGHTILEHNDKADMAVICSTLWLGKMFPNKAIYHMYRKSDRDVLIYDAGALIRGQTWRLGLNAVNAEGYFGPIGNDMARRNLLGVELTPWQKRAGPLVICAQQPRSHHWRDMPGVPLWCTRIIETAKKHNWKRIIVRPHPRSGIVHSDIRATGARIEFAKKTGEDTFDFEKVLESAAAIVSYSSNPGIIAAIKGVPIFVGNRSLAYPVRNGELDTLILKNYLDREQWFNDFVYTEWLEEEFKTGAPMARLLNSNTEEV